jgi:hypothetical protein
MKTLDFILLILADLLLADHDATLQQIVQYIQLASVRKTEEYDDAVSTSIRQRVIVARKGRGVSYWKKMASATG